MGAPRHQAAGDAIRAIVQPGGDGDHTLARQLVDTVTVVKRPGNGRNVDARFSSDILDFYWHRMSQAFPIMHDFSILVKVSAFRPWQKMARPRVRSYASIWL